MFDRIIENRIRERIEQFLKANEEWIASANRLSESIERLCSLIENGKIDANSLSEIGINEKTLKSMSKATREVSDTFKSFHKSLEKYKND